MLLSTLDGTIVATALPSIVDDIGGVTGITWVVTAYLLAQIATMPLYGKLGDVYGRKRIFLIAVGVFTVGSMLCGLAQSLDQLLAARALQGLGAGGLGPLAMAILGDLVPPRQLGRWLGYQGAIFAVGGDRRSARRRPVRRPPELALGVLLQRAARAVRDGHRLLQPQGAVPTDPALDRLPRLRAAHRRARSRVVLLTTAGGRSIAWASPEAAALLVGIVVLAGLFVRRERSAAEPFVPIRLFTNSVVRVVERPELHQRPALLLRHLLPAGVPPGGPRASARRSRACCSSRSWPRPRSRRCSRGGGWRRTGRYKVWPIAGSVLMTVGVALLATLGLGTPVGVASAFAAVLGTGIGFVMQTTLLALQNRVEATDLGIATSTVLLTRTLGGTVGTALFGAVLAAGLPAERRDPGRLRGRAADGVPRRDPVRPHLDRGRPPPPGAPAARPRPLHVTGAPFVRETGRETSRGRVPCRT